MKNPLKPFTIAITGDFGDHRTHEKVKTWIEANGGSFAPKISLDVTHLVCSREHYKKSVTMVQQARKIKSVKIVSFDWLEDTLMKRSRKTEKPYLMKALVKVAAKAKAEKKAVRRENVEMGLEIFEKSCREFQCEMHSGTDPFFTRRSYELDLMDLIDGYHIYRDRTDFLYDITLARIDLLTNKNERYALKLFETHDLPHYYCTYIKYTRPGSSATQVLAPLASSFETAISAFKKFFQVKTTKTWEERRAWGAGQGGGCFVYTAPGAGEPAGEVEGEEVDEDSEEDVDGRFATDSTVLQTEQESNGTSKSPADELVSVTPESPAQHITSI